MYRFGCRRISTKSIHHFLASICLLPPESLLLFFAACPLLTARGCAPPGQMVPWKTYDATRTSSTPHLTPRLQHFRRSSREKGHTHRGKQGQHCYLNISYLNIHLPICLGSFIKRCVAWIADQKKHGCNKWVPVDIHEEKIYLYFENMVAAMEVCGGQR